MSADSIEELKTKLKEKQAAYRTAKELKSRKQHALRQECIDLANRIELLEPQDESTTL